MPGTPQIQRGHRYCCPGDVTQGRQCPTACVRAPVAALLSAILPGLGHRYIGRRKIGDALLLGNLLILWGLYLVATQFQMTALRWLVTSRGLILLMLANVALLVYRAWVTSDAYSKATMFRSSAMISLGLAIVILLVLHRSSVVSSSPNTT